MGHFLPFYLLTAWKIKIKTKKTKKKPGDIIILSMCTKNYDQMMHGSWDMVCDGCNYFSFWAIFCSFTPLTACKIKMKKNEKTAWRFILHKHTKNYDQMMYSSWDMVCDRCNCYFSFWAVFFPFAPLTAQKTNFKKMKKNPGDIIILHMCTKNYDQFM